MLDGAPSRVGAAAVLFAVSLGAAYLPTASISFTVLRVPNLVFFLARHFGTGACLCIVEGSLAH